ncbi:hypothetical protein [Fimbriiglobus ruber]|uniref:Uncharacterized protein n=1 Tax=Fimbriiglobus ruber TaxID=1908690 RepID=A0A225DL68_9BACT|nr:hypothetical protein [Fimbriiglobus ruber]OWK38206.1 hypothetical protein FRUB_07326 [Fimbriiglobus ruber]
MNDNSAAGSDEIFQEGVTPVQAFSTPVIRPASGTELAPRLGRSSRVVASKPAQSKEAVGPVPTGIAKHESVEPVSG